MESSKHHNRPTLLLFLAILGLVGCKSTQLSQSNTYGAAERISVGQAGVANASFDTLLIKGKGKLETNQGKTTRFKYRVHLARDRQVWISVAALGIEGLRLLAMPDSVAIINRLEETYYTGSYEWLTRQTGVPFTYQMLEDVLLGNVHAYREPLLPGPPYHFGFQMGGYLVLYEQNERYQRPGRIVTQDSTGNGRAELVYRQYRDFGSVLFPQQLILKLMDGKLTGVHLEHKQVNPAPGDLPFSLRIPRNYQPMALPE